MERESEWEAGREMEYGVERGIEWETGRKTTLTTVSTSRKYEVKQRIETTKVKQHVFGA